MECVERGEAPGYDEGGEGGAGDGESENGPELVSEVRAVEVQAGVEYDGRNEEAVDHGVGNIEDVITKHPHHPLYLSSPPHSYLGSRQDILVSKKIFPTRPSSEPNTSRMTDSGTREVTFLIRSHSLMRRDRIIRMRR